MGGTVGGVVVVVVCSLFPSDSGVGVLDASSVKPAGSSVAVSVTLPLTACNTVWGGTGRGRG